MLLKPLPAIVFLGLLSSADACRGDAPELAWFYQSSSINPDSSSGVANDDAGRIYFLTNHGNFAALAKYDARGAFQWQKFIEGNGDVGGAEAFLDGSGGVYVAGSTNGSLGGANLGSYDAYVRKFDETGSVQWTGQFGTSYSESSVDAAANGVGDVYVVGELDLWRGDYPDRDVFIAKHASTGGLQWGEFFGTDGWEEPTGIAADALGNVFVTGYTTGELGSANSDGTDDAFVAKYDAAGVRQWVRQFGAAGLNPYVYSQDIAVDGLGNAYVAGIIGSGSSSDVFLRKYDSGGSVLWMRDLGAAEAEDSISLHVDQQGNVYVAGSTAGDLERPNAGASKAFADAYDAFVGMYDSAGELQWMRQFGTIASDFVTGVSADGLGNVYVAGTTRGHIDGVPRSSSYQDAFLAKITLAAPLPGDFDSDGVVDGADFLLWQRQVGQAPSVLSKDLNRHLAADGNRDGLVDGTDLALWKEGFGGASSPASAVPEPAGFALALLTMSGLGLGERRSSSGKSLAMKE